VHEVDRDLAEVSLTAMFTFSASGMMCPPMLIYLGCTTNKIAQKGHVNK